MPFWQFFRNWLIGWIGHALLVQPSISDHRKWPEMVVSAFTNQVSNMNKKLFLKCNFRSIGLQMETTFAFHLSIAISIFLKINFLFSPSVQWAIVKHRTEFMIFKRLLGNLEFREWTFDRALKNAADWLNIALHYV